MPSITEVLDRRLRSSSLSDRVAGLIRAALRGEAELRATVSGRSPTAAAGSAAGQAATPDQMPTNDLLALKEDDRPAPQGVYLTGITVAGFRGIGPETTLELTPGPGLTVVCGRNGTGKSSFAEAAELAMTGDDKRWSERSTEWQDGWRNLHVTAPRRVSVSFVAEDEGAGTTERSWSQAAGYTQCDTEHRFRRGVVADLGWSVAMTRYRPFLSAAEFDGLLRSTPSQMYDTFAGLLGLTDVADAEKRLGRQKTEWKKLAQAPGKALAALRDTLAASTDPRAAQAMALLADRRPDLRELSVLASGSSPADNGDDAALRTLASWRLPEPSEVTALARLLAEAVDRERGVAATAVGEADTVAQLLHLALDFQRAAPGCDCPVCGQGVLDDAWRHRADARMAECAATSIALRQAKQEVSRLLRVMQSAVASPPPVPAVLSDRAEASAAAFQDWHSLVSSSDVARIVADTDVRYRALHDAGVAMRAVAQRTLEDRADAWRPAATALASWVESARQAQLADAILAELDAAGSWLSEAASALRRERLGPLADRARHIWQDLGQDSSLQLEDVELVGTAGSTHRQLKCSMHVDGERCQGFSVASQGELHGLALSLFLPRATSDDSPFRFLVIDDPVQAMDPTRVHRLALLLANEATRRQVIVFTHDDRLPEAVRSLRLPNATIQQVRREEGSVVRLDDCSDPIQRYLDNARFVLDDRNLSEKARTIAATVLARDALEACAQRTFRRRKLSEGCTHEEVEARLLPKPRTKEQVALALDVSKGALRSRLAALDAASAIGTDGIEVCDALNAGAHGDLSWLNLHWRRSTQVLVEATARLIGVVAGS